MFTCGTDHSESLDLLIAPSCCFVSEKNKWHFQVSYSGYSCLCICNSLNSTFSNHWSCITVIVLYIHPLSWRTSSSPWQLSSMDHMLCISFILCAITLWPCVSPLKSSPHIISRRPPMTSSIWGELTLKIALMCASHTAFHVADIEANIYILMIFWSTVSRIAWKGYIIYKTHSQPCLR